MRGDRAQHGLVINDQPLARAPPRLDCAVERQFHVRHDQRLVEIIFWPSRDRPDMRPPGR